MVLKGLIKYYTLDYNVTQYPNSLLAVNEN